MSRYIDADYLYQTMNGQDEEFSLIDALQMIEDFPTADVRENVHGEWLIDEYNAEYCSSCGRHPYNDGEYYVAGWYSDFCPNCGVDMRTKKLT